MSNNDQSVQALFKNVFLAINVTYFGGSVSGVSEFLSLESPTNDDGRLP